MNFCLAYALENRKRIIDKVHNIITKTIPNQPLVQLDKTRLINRNHNHIEFKHGMWIHRKGATQAEIDMPGVIPGNMRDGSFIVEGLGNPSVSTIRIAHLDRRLSQCGLLPEYAQFEMPSP